MKRFVRQILLAAAAVALFAACGGPPRRTNEMLEYEASRQDVYAETVKARFPELAGDAASAYKKALEAHDDDEPEMAMHHTRIASFKWRTAMAKSRMRDASESTQNYENRLTVSEGKLKDAQKRLDDAKAALELTRKNHVLQREQRLQIVADKVKDGERMKADKYAPAELAKAQASLKTAQETLKAGRLKEADRQTDTADADANALIAAVKPKYDKEEAQRDRDSRLQALLVKSGGVPSAKGAITPRGFVLTLRGTFPRNKADIPGDQIATLDRVAEMAREFSEFNLSIESHTDNTGRKDALMTTSQNRAAAVLSHLAAKGVAPSRMSALGKGSSEPIADNRTRAGKEQNQRVEVVFLRQ